MTIANELQLLQTNLTAAYDSCEDKGATIPVNKNFNNLASCIDTISTGSSPVISSLSITPTTSAQTITAPSGTDGYSPISVSAVTSSIDANITAGNIKSGVSILGVTGSYEGSGGSAPIIESNYVINTDGTVTNFIVKAVTAGGGVVRNIALKPFSTSVKNQSNIYNWLDYTNDYTATWTDSTASISADDTQLKDFTFYKTIEYLNLPNLEIFNSSQFLQNNTSLKKVNLKGLKKASLAVAFAGCTSLNEVDLSSLEDISYRNALGGSSSIGGAFANTAITTLSFPSLKSTSFGSYTNQFNYMLKGVTGCTVHFPSNLQSVIGNWSSVTTGFGGTNTVVSFDLPATT